LPVARKLKIRDEEKSRSMIKQANVTMMVSDMKMAVKFYTGTRGLKLKAQYGDEFAQVEALGTIIALHPAGKSGPRPGDTQSLRSVSPSTTSRRQWPS